VNTGVVRIQVQVTPRSSKYRQCPRLMGRSPTRVAFQVTYDLWPVKDAIRTKGRTRRTSPPRGISHVSGWDIAGCQKWSSGSIEFSATLARHRCQRRRGPCPRQAERPSWIPCDCLQRIRSSTRWTLFICLFANGFNVGVRDYCRRDRENLVPEGEAERWAASGRAWPNSINSIAADDQRRPIQTMTKLLSRID
jgi:hypothetical protein